MSDRIPLLFDPPYKGTNRETNFPIIVLAIDGSMALIISDEGNMDWIRVNQVNVDWRWDPNKRTFISIDNPIED